MRSKFIDALIMGLEQALAEQQTVQGELNADEAQGHVYRHHLGDPLEVLLEFPDGIASRRQGGELSGRL